MWPAEPQRMQTNAEDHGGSLALCWLCGLCMIPRVLITAVPAAWKQVLIAYFLAFFSNNRLEVGHHRYIMTYSL